MDTLRCSLPAGRSLVGLGTLLGLGSKAVDRSRPAQAAAAPNERPLPRLDACLRHACPVYFDTPTVLSGRHRTSHLDDGSGAVESETVMCRVL